MRSILILFVFFQIALGCSNPKYSKGTNQGKDNDSFKQRSTSKNNEEKELPKEIVIKLRNLGIVDSLVKFWGKNVNINLIRGGHFFTQSHFQKLEISVDGNIILNDSGRFTIEFQNVSVHLLKQHRLSVLISYVKSNTGNTDTAKCFWFSDQIKCKQIAIVSPPTGDGISGKLPFECNIELSNDSFLIRNKSLFDKHLDENISYIKSVLHYN